jgi:hypothetical protein
MEEVNVLVRMVMMDVVCKNVSDQVLFIEWLKGNVNIVKLKAAVMIIISRVNIVMNGKAIVAVDIANENDAHQDYQVTNLKRVGVANIVTHHFANGIRLSTGHIAALDRNVFTVIRISH